MSKVHHLKPERAVLYLVCALCGGLFMSGCGPETARNVREAPPDPRVWQAAAPVVSPAPDRFLLPKPGPVPVKEPEKPALEPWLAVNSMEPEPDPTTITPEAEAEDFLTEALAEHDAAFHVLRRGNPNLKEVALTFDDGPHPEFLPRLLDRLRELDVHATFFVVGEKVAEAPDMVARIVEDGHEVASHTYHHLKLTEIPVEYVESELKTNNEIIYQACGVRPRFFRPPGGSSDEDVFRIARQEHLTTVLWTDDPADFASPGAAVIEKRLLKHIRPGAIILLHSGIEQTLAMLPDFVAQLRHDGYRFVTMTEMTQHLETNPRLALR